MKSLPEVSESDVLVWDDERSKCCGYLEKKTSKSSFMSKGKWQKRWFSINIDLDDRENYRLSYYHSPEDSLPRQTYDLVNASIRVSGGINFVLILSDDTSLSLKCEDSPLLKAWVHTLESIIAVANQRDRALQSDLSEHGLVTENRLRKPLPGESYGDHDDTRSTSHSQSQSPSKKSLTSTATRSCPALRFDIDANTIPPTSTARHLFMGRFVGDVSRAAKISQDCIEVVSIRPAPGLDWLTMVEFDIKPIMEIYGDEDDAMMEQIQYEYRELRTNMLWTVHQLWADRSSALYKGLVTCKLDPSYASNLVEKADDADEVIPYSTDLEVLRVMERYKDVHIAPDYVDLTHFSIELCFESRVVHMKIPNPLILRKRCCALWPFEVKQALGFMGNMQELWIEPIALVPQGMPKLLSQPIYFEPSVRAGGAKLINASLLKAEQSYEVQCNDRREEALDALSQEEMDQIKETFNQCDINGDGGIFKSEMAELVRHRTQERRAVIEERFQAYISESDISASEIKSAEMTKAMLLQSLLEAQSKLLGMFESIDIDSDGSISFTEFVMAEAWWLRCTLNPERAHLF